MHDTWGIPGPTFLWMFWIEAAFLLTGALVCRRIAFGGRPSDQRLGAEKVAYLAGGPRLAVYASLGALRGAGAVSVNNKRVYSGTAPMPSDATRLDYATCQATAGGYSAAELPTHPQIEAELAQ